MSSEKPILKILTNRYFLATAGFLVIIMFASKNNVVRWIGASNELDQQEKMIEYYNREIENIEREINQLTSNQDSLEKFAREKYFYQREDEEVFIVK